METSKFITGCLIGVALAVVLFFLSWPDFYNPTGWWHIAGIIVSVIIFFVSITPILNHIAPELEEKKKAKTKK